MAQQSRTTLKTYFNTGDIPTESQFIDLIDSIYNISDDGSVPTNNLAASVAPTVSNDSSGGYSVGSTWVDTTNDDVYRCVDATIGAAVWVQLDSATLLDKTDATVAPTVNEDSGDGYAVGSAWIDVTADASYILLDATVGAAVWAQTNNSSAGSSGFSGSSATYLMRFNPSDSAVTFNGSYDTVGNSDGAVIGIQNPVLTESTSQRNFSAAHLAKTISATWFGRCTVSPNGNPDSRVGFVESALPLQPGSLLLPNFMFAGFEFSTSFPIRLVAANNTIATFANITGETSVIFPKTYKLELDSTNLTGFINGVQVAQIAHGFTTSEDCFFGAGAGSGQSDTWEMSPIEITQALGT